VTDRIPCFLQLAIWPCLGLDGIEGGHDISAYLAQSTMGLEAADTV
jgi:hypothetical protein